MGEGEGEEEEEEEEEEEKYTVEGKRKREKRSPYLSTPSSAAGTTSYMIKIIPERNICRQ